MYETGCWLGQVLRGWLQYHAVPTSYRSLGTFIYQVKRIWMRVPLSRSQKDRFRLKRQKRMAGSEDCPSVAYRPIHRYYRRQEPDALTRPSG
ncbi:MAG: hypothetical protein OXN89_13230 [Bryobacterales bacterium]|nr:hypothetical protein [Bryobacterales bacterium]